MQISNIPTNNAYKIQLKTNNIKTMTRPNFNTTCDKVSFSGFTAPREREINIIRQQLCGNDLIKLGRNFYAEYLMENINALENKIADNKRIAAHNKLLKGLGLDMEKKGLFDFLKPSTILRKREEAKKLAPVKKELGDYCAEYYSYKREKAIMQKDLSHQIFNQRKTSKDFIYPDVDEKFSNKLINHILQALPDNLKTTYKDSGEFELSRETRDNVANIIHNSSSWTDLKGKFVANFLITPEEKKSIYDEFKQELKSMEKIAHDMTYSGQSLFDEDDIKMLSDKNTLESTAESFLLGKYEGKDCFKL